MSATALRLQLFGIALVLYGGFYDLQHAVLGYNDPGGDASLGAYVVTAGMLLVFVGLVAPALRASDGGDAQSRGE
ncbi:MULTISPECIES: hypothetical protein [Haloglomus]|jgi:hypothetical protein|uniref:hypothetical protein n=1 Tax=Haloglomus TaxID=2806252 RepID=UPI0020CA0CA2|nr:MULTISPECIES: hypothetical protein [Haloglomus]